MLLVETYLDRSALSGIGVFTTHALAAGTRIWEPRPWVDLRFSAQQWELWLERLSLPVQADMRRHSYKEGGAIVLCLDNARFMNHGGDASNVENEAATDTMFARWDIAAGSELLCDYRAYSDSDDVHLLALDARWEAPHAPAADL